MSNVKGVKPRGKTPTKGNYIMSDVHGTIKSIPAKIFDDMVSPVACAHCGQIYDLAAAEVNHRFMDCTQYKTPCCGKLSDDREWKSYPDYKRIDLSQYTLVN